MLEATLQGIRQVVQDIRISLLCSNSLGQQEDLLAFGKIILALACNSTQSFHNLPQSFEFMSRYYSPDLKNVVLYLLSQPMPTKTIDEVVTLIGPRILHEINSSHS